MNRRFMLVALLFPLVCAAASAHGRQPVAVLRGCGGSGVSFSADGSKLLTFATDAARVWDAKTFKPLTPPLRHGGTLIEAYMSADGSRVLTSDGVSVQAWDVETGKPLGRHLKPVSSGRIVAAISPDGRTALTGTCPPRGDLSSPTPDDAIATVWELSTSKPIVRLAHDSFVPFVAYSPNGGRIVTVSGETRSHEHINIWDSHTGRQIATTVDFDDARGGIVFSRDGRRFALAMYYAAGVYDTATGAAIAVITGFKHEHLPDAVAVSADGSRVATHDQFGDTKVWDVKTGRQIGKTIQSFAEVAQVVVNPDATQLLASPADDSDAGVFDVANGRILLSLPAEFHVAAFSPDGKSLAVGGNDDRSTQIWETTSRRD